MKNITPIKTTVKPQFKHSNSLKTFGTIGISILGTQIINNVLHILPTDVYKKISPSVHTVAAIELYSDPFSPHNLSERVIGTGTGFSYLKDEYIITNAHVINNSFTVQVDNENAEIIGIDNRHDIALLKVTKGAKAIRKCTNFVDIGTSVLAIGNPYGFDKSLTTGVISGKHRKLESDTRLPLLGLLQTDAAINPGNSGGPLIDAQKGCVLGVNTALVSSNGVNSGIGFAVPIETVDTIVHEMLSQKDHEMVRLGVTLLPDMISEGLGIKGVIIGSVIPGSLAADLEFIGTHRDGTGRPIIGDIILEINGHITKKISDIYEKLESLKTGDDIHLKILKHDGTHEYNVTI